MTDASHRDTDWEVPQVVRACYTDYLGSCVPDEFTGCAAAPWVTNFMKSDSASRDGYTSPPTPKNRQKLMISGRQRTVAQQQLFFDMQLNDMHLEHIGAHVLAEGTEIVHDALHLYVALAHPRRRHRFRSNRSKSGDAEFVRFIQ